LILYYGNDFFVFLNIVICTLFTSVCCTLFTFKFNVHSLLYYLFSRVVTLIISVLRIMAVIIREHCWQTEFCWVSLQRSDYCAERTLVVISLSAYCNILHTFILIKR